MPIHQEVSFVAAPERVYHLLTDSAEFAAATERSAKIAATEGGSDFIHVLYSASSCAIDNAANATILAIRTEVLRMAGIYHKPG